VATLPAEGQQWWREQHDEAEVHEAALVGAGASRAASVADLVG
jgi:lysine 2,3-aminomutase